MSLYLPDRAPLLVHEMNNKNISLDMVAQSDFLKKEILLLKEKKLETETGLNQMSNLQQPGDTRRSSHLKSISSSIKFI